MRVGIQLHPIGSRQWRRIFLLLFHGLHGRHFLRFDSHARTAMGGHDSHLITSLSGVVTGPLHRHYDPLSWPPLVLFRSHVRYHNCITYLTRITWRCRGSVHYMTVQVVSLLFDGARGVSVSHEGDGARGQCITWRWRWAVYHMTAHVISVLHDGAGSQNITWRRRESKYYLTVQVVRVLHDVAGGQSITWRWRGLVYYITRELHDGESGQSTKWRHKWSEYYMTVQVVRALNDATGGQRITWQCKWSEYYMTVQEVWILHMTYDARRRIARLF